MPIFVPHHIYMHQFSHTVSILFHPFFIPLYGMLLLFQINPYMFGSYGSGVEIRLIMIVITNTLVFPFITIALMKKIGLVKTVELDDRYDRIIPYIAGCLFYFWCYMSIKSLPVTYVPAQLMLGATLAVFATFFFNLFFKISAHAAAMGSLLGFLIMVYPHSVYDLNLIISAVILIGGIVCTARYYLGIHTHIQLLSGYFVGYLGQWIAFNFF